MDIEKLSRLIISNCDSVASRIRKKASICTDKCKLDQHKNEIATVERLFTKKIELVEEKNFRTLKSFDARNVLGTSREINRECDKYNEFKSLDEMEEEYKGHEREEQLHSKLISCILLEPEDLGDQMTTENVWGAIGYLVLVNKYLTPTQLSVLKHVLAHCNLSQRLQMNNPFFELDPENFGTNMLEFAISYDIPSHREKYQIKLKLREFLSSINKLSISNVYIKSVKADFLFVLRHIKRIDLNCSEYTLTSELKRTIQALNTRAVSLNGIQLYPSQLDSELASKLKSVHKIIHYNWTSNALQVYEWHNLEELCINDSRVDTLRSNTFERLTSLRKLDLCHNGIEAIERNAFKNLSRLRTLLMSYNNLRCIRKVYFQELIGLEQLIINNNQIEAIEVGAFDTLRKLRSLFLCNNQFRDDETTLWALFGNTFTKLDEYKITSARVSINNLIARSYVPPTPLPRLLRTPSPQRPALGDDYPYTPVPPTPGFRHQRLDLGDLHTEFRLQPPPANRRELDEFRRPAAAQNYPNRPANCLDNEDDDDSSRITSVVSTPLSNASSFCVLNLSSSGFSSFPNSSDLSVTFSSSDESLSPSSSSLSSSTSSSPSSSSSSPSSLCLSSSDGGDGDGEPKVEPPQPFVFNDETEITVNYVRALPFF